MFPRAQPLNLSHLLQLVASGVSEPHKVLEKSFEWEHARELELSKWSLALGASLLVAMAAASLSKQFDRDSAILGVKFLYIGAGTAAFFVVLGLGTFYRARFIHRRYFLAAALLGRLV